MLRNGLFPSGSPTGRPAAPALQNSTWPSPSRSASGTLSCCAPSGPASSGRGYRRRLTNFAITVVAHSEHLISTTNYDVTRRVIRFAAAFSARTIYATVRRFPGPWPDQASRDDERFTQGADAALDARSLAPNQFNVIDASWRPRSRHFGPCILSSAAATTRSVSRRSDRL
jgi:hypothetical protein